MHFRDYRREPRTGDKMFSGIGFHAEQNNETNMFSTDNGPEVVVDDDNSEISMPNIFEVETKFS